MVELGLRAAVAERGGADSARTVGSRERQRIVDQAVEECLAWKTPRSEARCVARAQDEADIDGCVQR
jgi:hypothetical protein